MIIVKSFVEYAQNREARIEMELQNKAKTGYNHLGHNNRENNIQAWIAEGRIRVKQKDIDPELAREAVRLLGEMHTYLSGGLGFPEKIIAEGAYHTDIKALLSKLEESE